MIKSFTFARLPKIYFGPGVINQLGSIVKPYGSKALIISGATSLVKSGIYMNLVKMVQEAGLHVFSEQILTEPSAPAIDIITGLYHHKNIGVVIAIGGGSVLDAGKAISAMLPLNEPVKDYLEGVGSKSPNGKKIPMIAIPTTAGTGSETTKNAVISEIGPNGYKKSLRHDNYVPDVAIVDPELAMNCPPQITAYSGMDAFTQLLESFLSDKCDVMTEHLVLSAFESIKRSLYKVYKKGKDMAARTDMAYAAMISGISLANAGLGVIHGFASPLGGLFTIPHGVVCGSLMAVCNEYTFKKLLDSNDLISLEKYRIVAGLFMNVPNPDNETVRFFLNWLYEITEQLKIPKLNKYGIEVDDVPKIASMASMKNNPAHFTQNELAEILTARL